MLPTLIMSIISGEASDAAARARRAAIIYVLAGLLLLGFVGFLVGAAFIAAARRLGNLEASLAFAAVCLVAAILLVAGYRIWSKARRRRTSERRKREVTGLASAAGLALLPTLLSNKRAVAGLAVPLLAALAFVVWRENNSSRAKNPRKG